MLVSRKAFGDLAEVVLEGGAKKATKYFSPTEVLKATRQGKGRKGARTVTILFTLGRPNYVERGFIRKAQKAGESFPVKKIQLKWDKE